MFIDWLSMWQEFRGEDREFMSGRVVSIDGACGLHHRRVTNPETGELGNVFVFTGEAADEDIEIEFNTAKFGQHRGSFETAIQIRMANGRLEVRGNPSAYGRLDNLMGVTLDQGVAIYNGILRELGLPEFTTGSAIQYESQRDGETIEDWTGANITRCDVTENVAVGCGNVAAYHQWVAAQKVSRNAPDDSRLAQFARWDWSTVYSAESKVWATHKHYDKAKQLQEVTLPEYARKLRAAVRRRDLLSHEADALHSEAQAYLENLACWCAEQGISRSEISYRRRWMTQTKLGRWIPGETEAAIYARAGQDMGKLWDRAIVYQVDAQERLTASEFAALQRWRQGVDVREVMSKATFYRVRASLLKKTGHDIAARPNGVAQVERRPVFFKVRPVTASALPAWYVPAQVPGLERLAA